MPFALIIAGLVLTIAGVRKTQGDLFALLKGDFTGDKSFLWWMVSILGIGSLGYVKDLKPFSNAFLALVLVVLILANKGVFEKFTQGLKSAQSGVSPVNDNAPNTLATGQAALRGALQQ